MQERDYAGQVTGQRFCYRCGFKWPGGWGARSYVSVGGVSFDLTHCIQECEAKCFVCAKPVSDWRWKFIECFPRIVCGACFKSAKGGAK